MNILITGATGFLGRNLVPFLVQSGYNIMAVGRDKAKLEKFFPDEKITKRITDYSYDSLIKIIKDREIVIHLASQLMERETHPLKISGFDKNIQIVENLIMACDEARVKKLINISTISVYPLNQNLTETQACAPWNIYGVSKANIDTYLIYIQRKVLTKIVSLRLARLYGYGEREGLMFTDFVNKARHKEVLTVYGNGASTVEYIYINDAVEAIRAVLENDELEGIYNIGSGVSLTVKEIAETVNSVFDNEGNITYVNDKFDAIKGSEMNVNKAKLELNWEAKWNLIQSVIDIKRKIENEQK